MSLKKKLSYNIESVLLAIPINDSDSNNNKIDLYFKNIDFNDSG